MIVALVARPSRRASYTPVLAAWLRPRSSQLRITTRASGPWPNRSASALTATTLPARGPQAAAARTSLGGGGTQVGAVGGVGGHEQRPGQPSSQQVVVDEETVRPP